jgi:hypothetical protein
MIEGIAVMSIKRNGCTTNQNSIRNCLLKPSCGFEYLLDSRARGLRIRTICVNGSIRRHMTRLSYLITRTTTHETRYAGAVISFQCDVKVVGVASGQPDYAEIPAGTPALAQAVIVLASPTLIGPALIGWRFRRRRSLIPGKS